MLKALIAWSARNPLLIVILALLSGLGGWQALRSLPLDAIPDLSDAQVIVFTEWPGRSPDLVEDQITYPLAATLMSAPKIKTVRAQSMFGMSFVYAIFEDGTDIYWARSRVLEYLNQAQSQLPAGITPVLGPDATGVGWGFQYALVDKTGRHNLADLRSFNDWHLRYWLKALPGVADVASVGGFVKQYQITLDPNVLQAYDLSLEQVAEAVRQSNNDVGGRAIEMGGREVIIRGRGYLKSLHELEQVVVGANASGTPVLLKQIARLSLGPELRRGLAELDGEGEVVGGIVMVRFGENVATVIERVKAELEQTRGAFPAGIELVTTYDRSGLIYDSLQTLRQKLWEESLVVSGVIILFLLHLRSALVILIALPLAVLMAFVPMYWLGLSANIMSLGGIAIAIGAMVDSGIVMVENAHKKLEQGDPRPHKERIIEAAQEVGPSLFYALLVITVSFLPVFLLQEQEGRLFKPLAYTKTFAMFFAALLSVTLVPVLMTWLVRGKIFSEQRHPVSRLLIALYTPLVKGALRWRWPVLLLALLTLVGTVPVYRSLGSEFMPRLWEGSSMYMPTTVPGISPTEAAHLLQVQARLLKTLPEVERVFGKAGRAETPTDPAPLNMIETVITFKPRDQWRPGLSPEALEREMNELLTLPGVSNGWTMPIKGRIDMLTTGIRTPLGIKVSGPDLKQIEALSTGIEARLRGLPGTRSVFAERLTGGSYLDIAIKRPEAARYGLSVAAIEAVIETAVGGQNLSTTIEGRERYPINLRYAQSFRADPQALGRVLVRTPGGAQVPLSQVASISLSSGPPMINSENGRLTGLVLIDSGDMDPGRYVAQATPVLQELQLPAGYTWHWSGQYELMQRVRSSLQTAVPVMLLLIFLLLYLNFGSLAQPLMIMLSLPFALVGAIWALKFYGYNLSTAVWVGIIALAGVAAETGIIMLLYLDQTCDERAAAGQLNTPAQLLQAVVDGAVLRVRPKLMTVATDTFGLLPIMWAHEVGSDVMQPIAAPMIGGMISSAFLTLVVLPCIYLIWKSRQLGHHRPAAPN